MKIALIHTRYLLKGGLETRLFNYINYFLERGHTVDLFASEIDSGIDQPQHLTVNHINVKKHFKPFRNYFFNKALEKIFNENHYDFALSLERTSVQKHVLAPNTHKGYLTAKHTFISDPIDWTQIHLENKTYKNADVIYACSKMVKNELINLYRVNPNKIQVLYPPTNTENYINPLTKEEARKKFKLNTSKIFFLFVSTSHKRKGLNLLLQVFNKLPEKYQLLVAGSPVEDTKNVNSLGYVKDMSALYKASDYLLHPSFYEPFGQIIIEAFTNKLPVIVSDKVGAQEFVNENNGIVLPIQDANLWRDTILSLENKSFSFENNASILEDLSLEKHMENMLAWAKLKK